MLCEDYCRAMHFSPKQKSKTFGQLHLYSLGIPLLASYTNVNQLSLKDAKKAGSMLIDFQHQMEGGE